MDSLLEARHQLAGLHRELERTNPELYRHLALYLQVLRQGLLPAIQQACFHLATQVHPERYCRMTAASRAELHARMADLVRRASALLTVEQVAAMAAQMARQERRLQQEAEGTAEDSAAGPSSAQPGFRTSQAGDPAGSVQLAMQPPIDPRHLQGKEDDGAGFSGAGAISETVQGHPPDLASLLGAMVEALDGPESEPAPGSAPPESHRSGRPDASASPWEGPLLPTEPPTLLQWLDGYERALARRLRNLSHALNVECLRLGVTRGLLPVSLLDAALNGQVEPQQAPPNLLRLAVPVGGEMGPEPMELVAVLLRLADLELEQPQLRTCRSRLQQHRQEVRRMAQQYRRVQRRVRTLEAERLWLEDNRRPRATQGHDLDRPQTSP